MGEQRTFASVAWTQKGKVTRRERFLAEMDAVIPWGELLALIEPHYPKAGNGRQPLGLEKMLRTYFLQQWFNLSDPQAEDALYDSESMRRFAPIELGDDRVPDETTILRFRHLLEEHHLTAAIIDAVNELLAAKCLLVHTGTIVDATILAAPSSTKNASRERDPEMKQTRKGNNWHFGMKLHIGTDLRGRVHSVTATHAATGDSTQMPPPPARARAGLPGARGRAIGSIAGHRTAITRSPRAGGRSTGHARRCAPAASIPFTSSSACGASPRCATAG